MSPEQIRLEALDRALGCLGSRASCGAVVAVAGLFARFVETGAGPQLNEHVLHGLEAELAAMAAGLPAATSRQGQGQAVVPGSGDVCGEKGNAADVQQVGGSA